MLTVKCKNLQLQPESVSEVANLVSFAGKRKLMIVPVNRGCSLQKMHLGRRNRLFVNLSRLDKVLDFSPEDFYITLQAGYPVSELNSKLAPFERFFPFSDSKLSESAASLVCKNVCAQKEGEKLQVKKFTVALEVVTSGGEIVNTGRVTFKNVVGYDLVRLFCGSWGSLGIITAVTFRILPAPQLREYKNLRFLEPEVPSSGEVKTLAKRELLRNIKSAFDPKGVFLSPFALK